MESARAITSRGRLGCCAWPPLALHMTRLMCNWVCWALRAWQQLRACSCHEGWSVESLWCCITFCGLSSDA